MIRALPLFYFLNNNNESQYISLDEIINFLIYRSNNINCNYYEFMDLIHIMYNIDIKNNLPNYYTVDKSIRDKITPITTGTTNDMSSLKSSINKSNINSCFEL